MPSAPRVLHPRCNQHACLLPGTRRTHTATTCAAPRPEPHADGLLWASIPASLHACDVPRGARARFTAAARRCRNPEDDVRRRAPRLSPAAACRRRRRPAPDLHDPGGTRRPGRPSPPRPVLREFRRGARRSTTRATPPPSPRPTSPTSTDSPRSWSATGPGNVYALPRQRRRRRRRLALPGRRARGLVAVGGAHRRRRPRHGLRRHRQREPPRRTGGYQAITPAAATSGSSRRPTRRPTPPIRAWRRR